MNTAMYEHPTTQSSLRKLSAMGIEILETGTGDLACGEIGAGRLMEPEQIFAAVQQKLKAKSKERKKILVTSGGTSEALDDVRVITNKSTGATGAAIA